MNAQIEAYLAQYPETIIQMYRAIRQTLFDSVPHEPEEKQWAKLPSCFSGAAFVRLIPFRDHINIEARAVLQHREALTGFRITPKGMLQIYEKQEIPHAILQRIFAESFAAAP